MEEEREEETSVVKSEKAQRLIEKYQTLVEKLMQEPMNPMKLLMVRFKLNQLQAQIQEEIDLEQSREEFDFRRSEVEKKKDGTYINNIAKRAELVARKKFLVNKLRANEEYDPESPEFLYADILKAQGGDIEPILETLSANKGEIAKYTIKTINDMIQARSELEQVEDEIEEVKRESKDGERDYKRGMMETDLEEMAMTVGSKLNIFAKIGNWINSGRKAISETLRVRQGIRALREQKKQRDQEIKNRRKDSIAFAKEEYQNELRIIEEQKRELAEREKIAKAYYNERIKRANIQHDIDVNDSSGLTQADEQLFRNQRQTNSARAYSEKLRRMAGGVIPQVKTRASGDSEQGLEGEEEYVYRPPEGEGR